jgi:hypothetical protein
MQEAIKKSDLVTGSPFEEIGREIASTLGILEKFDSELKSIAKTMNGELATAQKKTVQDINAINQAEIESEKLLQQKLRTEKLQLDLRQKQERMAKQAQSQAEKDARTTATQIRNQERLNSVYSRVDQKLSAMTKTYRDLAIRKELGVKLTDKEQKNYDYLQAKIQKYDNALKTVDATMGKHQRNVGNYAMANSQLNFSVTQLAREMPAFANSVQTGFMAISNNLPMFFDEIGKLKKANVELRAQGEPTKNVFKALAGSLMSTQVLLSVGVTLLTVYGAKMIEFLGTLVPVNKELEKQRQEQEWANKSRQESAKFLADESSEFLGNINALRNSNAGSKERAKMIKLINAEHGTTIKNLKDEALFQRQLNDQVKSFLELQIAEYKSKRNIGLINANLQKQDKLTYEIQKGKKEEIRLEKELELAKKSSANASKQIVTGGGSSMGTGGATIYQENYEKKVLQVTDALNKQRAELKANEDELVNAQKRLTTYDVAIKEDTKSTTTQTKAQKELNTELDTTNVYLGIQAQLLHELAQLRYNEAITAIDKQFNSELKAQEILAEVTGKYTLDSLVALLDEKAKIQKQALHEQEVYELSQLALKYKAETDAEIKALNDKRAKLLEQEGLTASQKAEIEKQYQADLKTIEANAVKRKADYDLQAQITQQKNGDEGVAIDKGIADKKQEISDGLAEKATENSDKVKETEKKNAQEAFEFMQSIQQAITDMLKEQIDRRIALLKKEEEAAKSQQDYLQNLAAQGNIYAQQSITEQIQIQRDAQAEQMRLEKQKQSIELISTGLKTFESALNEGKSPGEALASTIVSTTVLTSFLKNLQFYEKGTMNAPGGLSVVDEKGQEMITDRLGNIKELGAGKGARFTMLNRGDKVYTASQTASMLSAFDNHGNASKLSKMDKAGTSFDLMNMTKEIKVLQGIVQNKSETNIAWQSFASGINEIVQTKHANGVISRNRFRIN